jgi:tetratricopeptide (TPR) repeat protein
VEGRFRETAKDWPKAIEIYHSLFGFFPDNLEYGFRLATVQGAAQQGAAALTTVEALRKLPAAADDPRIDLAEAQALASLSDYRRGRAAAARAVEKGQRIGATLLVARAREFEGWALLNLGTSADALRTFDEASKTYATA